MNWKYIGFTVVILAYQARVIHLQCQQVNASNGIISDIYKVIGIKVIQRCWEVAVAAHHFINATIELREYPSKENRNCDNAYIDVKMNNVGSKKFCSFDRIKNDLWFKTANDSFFKLVFYVIPSRYRNGHRFAFHLKYSIQPSILGVKGINEVRENSINWLKMEHNPSWDWKENAPRAVTALYLAGGAQFNGSLIEEMMAKQTELTTALALTWDSVSTERLSTFINSLLTICLNPRHFYGHDLVARLKKQVKSSGNFTHPAAYLSLCNANETWPDRYASDLTHVLTSKSDYHFIRDLQAFALMALSCDYHRRNSVVEIEDSNLRSLYFKTIKRMKEYQRHDGSFGNPHTTALFTQALIASDQEFAKDWKMNDNIQYLMKELNSSGLNFLNVYAILPLLNEKTLADIAHIKCTNKPRFEGDDPLPEVKNNEGQKIRVQYSLYIGHQKDVIHNISLLVSRNFTAYMIMELAAFQDKKYEFKVETIGALKHVYEIAGIPNDPEDGKFWLMYAKPRYSAILSHYTSDPDGLVLGDGGHLIMWYKNQQI